MVLVLRKRPLATKSPAIVKWGGTLTVSGCVMKDIRLKGVSCGIQNADYIEHTDIELINLSDVANAGGDAIKGGATKRIIGGKMGGRITITSDCHNAAFLAHAFPEAVKLAKECGFTSAFRLGTGDELFEEVKL